jgi:hypothetical protein
MHFSPAAFPLGMPGIIELIDGAMQQAPQDSLQSIFISLTEKANTNLKSAKANEKYVFFETDCIHLKCIKNIL